MRRVQQVMSFFFSSWKKYNNQIIHYWSVIGRVKIWQWFSVRSHIGCHAILMSTLMNNSTGAGPARPFIETNVKLVILQISTFLTLDNRSNFKQIVSVSNSFVCFRNVKSTQVQCKFSGLWKKKIENMIQRREYASITLDFLTGQNQYGR